MEEKITFSELSGFFGKQKEFLNSTKNNKYVLYGGSVGSGKSYALRWVVLYWLLKWWAEGKKNLIGGIFCKTYKELEDRHLKYIRQEFPSWLGEFYEQKHEFHLFQEYGGGIISFRNLDEPEKYYSSEFAIIAVDEITEIPYETFKKLLTRLRSPQIEETKFICASNPIGEGLLWVRQFFVEKTLMPDLKNEIHYVKALPTDNPHLPQSYFENLKSLSERERRAYLEGDWYAFEDVIDERGYIPLITPKELENCLLEEGAYFFKQTKSILGVDVGAGGDKTAIVLRNEIMAKVLFNQKLQDTMAVIPLIAKFFNIYKIYGICIDIVGVGRGIYDRLQEIGLVRQTMGVNFGSKPEESGFENKKAELFWRTRDWLLKGGKLIKDEGWNELLSVKYKSKSDKSISIIPKEIIRKQGLTSPDVADALALTFEISLMRVPELYEFQDIRFELK